MKNNRWKWLFAICATCIFIGVGTFTVLYHYGITIGKSENIITPNLHVTFFNMDDGDCIYINCGYVDILIDSGEKSDEELKNTLKSSIKDGILEYVFVTHGDSDHIGNMADVFSCFNPDSKNCFTTANSTKYCINNIVDFDSKNKSGVFNSENYNAYCNARDSLVKNGTSYKSVADVFGTDSIPTNGHCFTFLGSDLKIHLLNNVNYLTSFASQMTTSAYKNIMSTCLLLEYGDSKVLLTGDLEEYDSGNKYAQIFGESNLLQYNPILNDGVTLYKAGHHGSRTSNSKEFIQTISPKYVMITCLGDGPSYDFPSIEALNNFMSVTNNIYISSYYTNYAGPVAYYGTVEFTLDKKENVTVDSSQKDLSSDIYVDDVLRPAVETSWFIDRTSLNTHVFSGFVSEINTYVGNCTLLEYGQYDILIDCGIYGVIGNNAILANNFINKINNLCLDKKIDYLIVTSPLTTSIQQLVDRTKTDETVIKGLFSQFKVSNLIDFGTTYDPSDNASNSLYSLYINQRQTLFTEDENYFSAKKCIQNSLSFDLTDYFSIHIMDNPYYNTDSFESAVCCYIEFCGKKLVFCGDISKDGEQAIADNLGDFSGTVFFKTIDNGYDGANSKEFLDKIITDANSAYIACNTTANEYIFGKKILSESLVRRLLSHSKFVYFTTEKINDKYNDVCGDIVFSLRTKDGKTIFKTSIIGTNGLTLITNTDYYKGL